jgi:hypothetical protein
VWVTDVNDVEEERHRENRTTAANQSERDVAQLAAKSVIAFATFATV